MADELDFYPYGKPTVPVPTQQCVRVRGCAYSLRKTGPEGVQRDDAAVAEADNARARKPRKGGR